MTFSCRPYHAVYVNDSPTCPPSPSSRHLHIISTPTCVQVCVSGTAGALCMAEPSCDKICENCQASDCPFGALCSATEGECTLMEGDASCPSS